MKGAKRMFVVYVLLFAAAVAVLPPLFRWFMGRMGLMGLEKQCRKKGYGFTKRNRLWFLGSKYGKEADFAIETEECVYAVKLFGVPRKLSHMLLLKDGRYVLRREFGLLLKVRFHFDTEPAPFPAYDFNRFAADQEKKVRPVLLVHPAPLDIRLQNPESDCRGFCCGNTFAGMEIVTLKVFQDML